MALDNFEYANDYLDGDGLELVWDLAKSKFASKDEIGNGKLTIQKNGTEVGSFTANQSGDTTINLAIPTTDDFAAKNHTHGNITSGGTITANGVALATGDTLVIVDASDSNKIKKTTIAFDGSTTNKFLSQKGTWSDTVAKATDADTLDGKHASAFSLSGHTHETLTIGAKTYNGGTSVTVTAGDLSAYTKSEIDSMLSGNVKYSVVNSKPTTGETGVIYLVPGSKTATDNVKEEWMYINGAWELIGTTEAELSDYSKTGHMHDDRYYTETEIDNKLTGYTNQKAYSVIKVNGSGAMSATTVTDTFNFVEGDYITLSGGTKALKISTNLNFTSTPSETNKVVTKNDLPTVNRLTEAQIRAICV